MTLLHAAKPLAYVSYAWGDTTPEWEEREKLVNDVCSIFAQEGIVIGRDKNEVKPGDSIEEFATRIAKAPVILAVISHRSLRSEWCMLYELYAAYTRRGGNRKEFGNDVVALVLDDAFDDLDKAKMKSLMDYWDKWCSNFEEVLKVAEQHGRSKSPNSSKVLEVCKDMTASLPDMLLAINDLNMPRGSVAIRKDDFRIIRELVRNKLVPISATEPSTSFSQGMGSLAIGQTVSPPTPERKACDSVALFLARSGARNKYEWKAFVLRRGENQFQQIPNAFISAHAVYAKKELSKLIQCLRIWMASELAGESLLDIYLPIELLDEDWGGFCVEGCKPKKPMDTYQPYLLRSSDRLLKSTLNFRQTVLHQLHIHLRDGTGIWLPREHSDKRDVIENLSGQSLGEEDVASAICFFQSDISKSAKNRSAWIKSILNSALDSMAPLVVWPSKHCSLDDSQLQLCLNRLSINKEEIRDGKPVSRPHCPDQARLAETRRRSSLNGGELDIRGLQILVDHPDRALDRAMLQALFPSSRHGPSTRAAAKLAERKQQAHESPPSRQHFHPAAEAPSSGSADETPPAPTLPLFISP